MLDGDHGTHDVQRVLDGLAAGRLRLAIAEGDTGGVLLEWLTALPGSSAGVLGGVVAYHDDLKRQLLGVSAELLQRHGSVSAEVAEAMASGVRRLVGSDIGLATTGIAGPGGATPIKPVGLAFVAAAWGERTLVREHRWQGERASNRAASAQAALRLALELLGVLKMSKYRTDVLN
ncbi:MAG: CinA family protein [Chloroflexota bacterium]|nr:CinA family protein [Chloroflexota bacterium]